MSTQPSITEESKQKVVIIGAASVGKTCIIQKFTKGVFNNGEESTIGAAFVVNRVETSRGPVILNLWDTAGQERYKSLVPRYFKGAVAYIIVFDVSERASFDDAKDWLEIVRNESGANPIIFFVGNKIDIQPDFDLKEASDFAQEQGLTYWTTSAATGENIKQLFEDIGERVSVLQTAPQSGGINLVGEHEQKKSCC